MSNLEFTCNFQHVDVLALEYKGAVTRRHRQRRDLAEVRDDVLSDSVAEILLFRIAAHVGKGQYANRGARGPVGEGGRARSGNRRRGLGGWLPGNAGAECAHHFLCLRTPRIVAPVVEVGRVKCAYIDRQVGALEANGDEDAALSAFARLTTHPAGLHRIWSPDHQDGGSDLEFCGDPAVEFLAGKDLRVPPDRPDRKS